MDKSVSVIIPIYNVEDYLPRCLESVLSQTYHNLEIILVDDGSSDCSGEIADKFAKQDSRIQVIHKENGGVSSARNVGIDAAHGEYIYFADPDDYMMPDIITKMLNVNLKSGSDMCIVGYRREWIKNGDIIKSDVKAFHENLGNNSILKNLALLHRNTLLFMVWNKLFRTEIIKKQNIRFPNVKRLEDARFVYEYLNYVDKICYIPESLYCYKIYLNNRVTATKQFIPDFFASAALPLFGGGIQIIERFRNTCANVDVESFKNELGSHLFQSVSGDVTSNIALSPMGYFQKRKYIVKTVKHFISLGLKPEAAWFYNGIDHLIYYFILHSLYDPLLLFGMLYNFRNNKK